MSQIEDLSIALSWNEYLARLCVLFISDIYYIFLDKRRVQPEEGLQYPKYDHSNRHYRFSFFKTGIIFEQKRASGKQTRGITDQQFHVGMQMTLLVALFNAVILPAYSVIESNIVSIL